MGRTGTELGAEAARLLARTGEFAIAPGLTDTELERIESEFGIEFADDHRAFLAAGLPLNNPPTPHQTWARPWPDWRDGDREELAGRLAWPVDGTLFDVKHGFWFPAWGERPACSDEALATARRRLEDSPRMVPVYGHRYLPSGHGTSGHPVLSIYQTDIIVYGTDLAHYIDREFANEPPPPKLPADWTPPPMVRFWSEL